MAKDPAFLFYTNDFLTGVADLTMEERGQYITLLCLQHQKGALTEKAIMLLVGNAAPDVMAKFVKDKDGRFYNERMKIETEKRKKHSEKQRQNAYKRWNKKEDSQCDGNATAMPLEDENENRDKDEDEISLIYPFDTKEFLTAWTVWKTYKKEQWNFTYKSISTEQGALTILSKLTNDSEKAIEIINQSIGMGWRGFFKLSDNGKNNRSNSAAKTAANILEKRGLV